VIELFTPRSINHCCRNLAIAAELLHGAVIGSGKDGELFLRVDEVSAPITASWGLVKKALGILNISLCCKIPARPGRASGRAY